MSIKRTKKSIKGFTLIEVLIAMLILAVGLLGLAGMQARSIRANLSAYNRSQATQLAYNMADRMRANTTEARKYNNFPPSIYATVLAVNAGLQAGCTAIAGGCTPVQMARNDLAEWNILLTNPTNNRDLNALPNGTTGGITVAGTIYTISIFWDDNRDGCVMPRDIGVAGCALFPIDPNFAMSFQL